MSTGREMRDAACLPRQAKRGGYVARIVAVCKQFFGILILGVVLA